MKSNRNLWPDPTLLPNLYDSQIHVLRSVFKSKVCILAGTPGTGKTHVLAQIIRYLSGRHGAHTIRVAAPFGKAAVRITEALVSASIQGVEAQTVHRLLEVGRDGTSGGGWGFQRNESNPLEGTFYFVDEASTLDADLYAALIAAMPENAHLMLIGDPYQLPPVGHGAPLRDMINHANRTKDRSVIGHGELTEVQRNAGDIVAGCRNIKNGKPFQPNTTGINLDIGMNWRHWECRTPGHQVQKLDSLLSSLPERFNPIDDVQILCATNGSSNNGNANTGMNPVSRRALNLHLQSTLNPDNPIPHNAKFSIGDKVICTSNGELQLCKKISGRSGLDILEPTGDADLCANGEIGRVLQIDSPKKMAAIQLKNPSRIVLFPMGNTSGDGGRRAEFELGYAVTCHKMQGSQSPVIISMIDSSRGGDWVTSREWHYTAISRAETVCVTIGQWSSLMRQCQVVSLVKRKTFLEERIESIAAS